MAERKAVNKYYPPDWTPDKGSLNKYVGQHPLRERAKKLGQGILVIRFELPYNIWCGGCGSHVGMGVRYNAEKKKVGNYYSTPIYRFRMKCHLCDNYFEIETDPKNCEYNVVSGARRKEERWEPSATETVETTDREDAKRMAIDAMFKLEHGVEDVQKAKKAAPVLHHLQEVQSVWRDDYAANQELRKKFREEKKDIAIQQATDDDLRGRGSLDIPLVPERLEDIEHARRMKYDSEGFDEYRRKRRLQVKTRPFFEGQVKASEISSKLPSLMEKRRKIDSHFLAPSRGNTNNLTKYGILAKPRNKSDECSTSTEEITERSEDKTDTQTLEILYDEKMVASDTRRSADELNSESPTFKCTTCVRLETTRTSEENTSNEGNVISTVCYSKGKATHIISSETVGKGVSRIAVGGSADRPFEANDVQGRQKEIVRSSSDMCSGDSMSCPPAVTLQNSKPAEFIFSCAYSNSSESSDDSSDK